MKQMFILITLISYYSFASCQDVIRLQYGDSIPSKVIEVGRTEVKYLKQHYLDGPMYLIPNRKVIAIEHHNGEVEQLNTDKRTRNFRAGFSLSLGEGLDKIASTQYNGVRYIGIGHEGIIRIRATKRFSVMYHLDLKIGEYSYIEETATSRGTEWAYFAIPALYTGLEFRQPVYRDFGFFANAQIGWMNTMFIDPKTHWFDSPYASYMVSLGVYRKEFKMGVRYNTGVIDINSDIPQILQPGDYRLHMLEFVFTWEF